MAKKQHMRVINSPMHQPPRNYERRPSLTDPFIVDCVLAEDVLCGRDSNSMKHPGNKRFRDIIQSYCERYQESRKRSEKTDTTQEVISVVRENGGRFLRFESKLGCWVEVEQAHIHDKVSHALRSAKAQPKRSSTSGGNYEGTSEMETSEDEEENAFRTVSEVQEQIYQDLLNSFCHKGAGNRGSDSTNPSE